MCGIAGIIKLQPQSVSIDILKKMTDNIAHRGPDGEGQWINDDGNVGLGHRRLAIIDLSSAGAQPMHFLDRYTITFNGEIYNYLELRELLKKKGVIFKTDTDTEVLLALYHLYGPECLSHLDGMWAFAIWDKEKELLFCARDRFGEKPFYYSYKEGEYFIFGSEMKALWAYGIEKKIKKPRLDSYLNHNTLTNNSDFSETFYENILNLEHSHYMVINKSRELEKHRYYDIDWKSQNFNGSLTDAIDEFKRLFINSLSRRCRSDVPVGTSLSGGLDSSSIVCNMTGLIGIDHITPHTFSARFEGFKKDEGYFIDKVIKKTGVIPHYTWPTGDDMCRDFKKLCWHQEEPFGSSSIYAQYKVQQLAKENNVTVLIDGQGADEILAGYVFFYTEYLRSVHGNNHKHISINDEYHEYTKSFINHPEWKKSLLRRSNYYYWRHKLSYIKNGGYPSLNHFLYEHTMRGGLQELLRYADRNSMAHSREVRLPFLNHELVSFCFSLPDSFKLHMGWTKYIQRKSFEDILPYEIAWRKEKVGFEPPQNEWLKSFTPNLQWKDLMQKFF